jgi:hypothetical protein
MKRSLRKKLGLGEGKRLSDVALSVEAEVYFYLDLSCDGFAIFGCGGEFPHLHGIEGCLIKLGAKRTRDLDVARQAVRIDNEIQYYDPSMMGFALLFRVLGIGRVGRVWRRDTAWGVAVLAATNGNVILS